MILSKWLPVVLQLVQLVTAVENMSQFRRARGQGERKKALVKSLIGASAGVVRRFATDDLDPRVRDYYDELIDGAVDVAKFTGLIKAPNEDRVEAGRRLKEIAGDDDTLPADRTDEEAA